MFKNIYDITLKPGIAILLSLCVLRAPFLENIGKDLKLALFLIITGAFCFLIEYSIVKRKWFKKIIKFLKINYVRIVNIVSIPPTKLERYTVKDRVAEKYKNRIEEQIKNSYRIYFRLLSGHTMFFDEKEGFIRDSLRNLSNTDVRKRDIKIQLMDRSTPTFDERARRFVELKTEQETPDRISFTEYNTRCKEVENELITLIGRDRVTFYKRKYLWRLHIFDEVIFISSYSDNPSLVEGHLSPVYSFHREYDPAFFDAFLEEFNSLYKKP